MPIVKLDQDGLWVLHEVVRQDRMAPAFGAEHDLEFARKLWDGILELEQPARKGSTYPLSLTRGELLQITRQVSALIMQGSRPIGREILKLAFAALCEPVEVENVAIPTAYLSGDYDTDPDTDHRSLADSGAAAEPG